MDLLRDVLWWLATSDFGVPVLSGGVVVYALHRFKALGHLSRAMLLVTAIWIAFGVGLLVREFGMPAVRAVLDGPLVQREVLGWVKSTGGDWAIVRPADGEQFRFEYGPEDARAVVYRRGNRLVVEADMSDEDYAAALGSQNGAQRNFREAEITMVLAPQGLDWSNLQLRNPALSLTVSKNLSVREATFSDFLEATSQIEAARRLLKELPFWQASNAEWYKRQDEQQAELKRLIESTQSGDR